jgi:hypothetical protein
MVMTDAILRRRAKRI